MINIWGLVITFLVYKISTRLKKIKYIGKLPPTLITGVTLILVLKLFNLQYESYNESACIYTLLLGPATIALAYPLSENLNLLTKNKRAIYLGFITATFTALGVSYLLGKIFNCNWDIIISMLPKSVTTPIAIEISKTIGGIPELTACIVALTGIYGAIFGHKLLKLIHVKSDIAIGLAIGAASHVLGTSSCIEKNREKQIVTSTLALIVIGILTTIVCVFIFR